MELTAREKRAIMLETQTPAYARNPSGRRAIDFIWKRANNLRMALREAGINVQVSTNTVVPHRHEFVSGLNVPSNYFTTCGKEQYNKFRRLQGKAKKGLEARNA